MILKDEKRNLKEEKQKVNENYFVPNESNFKTDKKYERKNNENVIKDVYESINRSEKNNINDAHVEINDNNENKKNKILNYDNKNETNIKEQKENDLLNSKKSNSINKPLFSIQKLDGPNQSYDFNFKEKKTYRKRGRVKKLKNRRFHSKNDKDNIELKIHGLIIDSCRSFINKKLKKTLKKELKKVIYKEKRKINMDKKLKNIFKNASKGLNYNKDIIAHCGRKLKKIFNLRMYKVIQAISGVEIKILKNLRKEYNSLKEQKLLKEDKNYIKLFNEKEANLIKLELEKYPIIKENNKIEVLNSKNIIDINSSFKNNDKISEMIEFSNEKTTQVKTFDFKNNIDKAFISNTNNEKPDIKDLPYQNPVIETLFLGTMQDIPNINEKNVETEKFNGMPHFSVTNNISDSESSSSKYQLINIPQNDDML